MVIIEWLQANGLGLIAVVLTFGFMIFVHELGHFIMAKRVGITVHEFALGMGPKLLSFGGNKKKRKPGDAPEGSVVAGEREPESNEPVKTEYTLRAFPFGGFVSMEGEDGPGNLDDPGNFNNKNVWSRLKVILAGCTMNYITGFLILILIGVAWGIPTPEAQDPPAIVGNLVEGYPLQKAGLQAGDRIARVNDIEIRDFKHLSEVISPMTKGEEVKITVDRKGETITYMVNVKYNPETKRGMLGFSPQVSMMNFTFEKESFGTVVKHSMSTTGRLTIMPVTVVKMILSRQISGSDVVKGTTGPIGIGQLLFEVSKKGIPSLLFICAMLSILIGAFNLLPIPALDGSRALFLAIEGIRGKPVDPEKEGRIHQLGFIFLIILMVLVSFQDILRLIRGENLLK